LGAYSQAGWEYAIECDWERLESLLGNVQSSRLGVCHRVQLGVYLKACSGVCLRAFCELTWERKSSRQGVCNRLQSGVYLRAYLGAGNEVHLAVLLNAA